MKLLSFIPFALIPKISNMIQLTRPQNIPSVVALSVAGGVIMNPISSLCSQPFWISAVESTLIMSNSMILNDICDIEIDRINSLERPLVTGAIKKKEAITFSVILSTISEAINIIYLPRRLQWIVHIALLYIHLYTPVLKRIPFIKNISCAILVAFSLLFSGIAASPIPFFENMNRGILIIAANSIFGGSWVNEIILDIRDEIGDKKSGIHTLVTLFGNKSAWSIAFLILYVNIIMNIIWLLKLGIHPGIYIGIMAPQIYKLYCMNNCMFSKDLIQCYLKYTNQTMIALLLFFIFQTIKRG